MATSKKTSKTRRKAAKAPAKKKAPAGKKSAKKKGSASGRSAATRKNSSKKVVGKKKTARKPAKKKAATKKAATKKAATKKAATKKAATKKAAKTVSSKSSSPAASPSVGKKVRSKKTPARMRSGLRKIREVLLDKRQLLMEQLRAELREMERPEKRHRADLEEIASDTHDSDSLCQIMDINASQLDQIDAALKKIDDGTYGICEDCGDEISLPRLEALPFATQCIECKRRAELAQLRPAEYYSAGFDA